MMATKKLSDNQFVLLSFLVWRIVTLIPVIISGFFFKLQSNFLGGGMEAYTKNPLFFSWVNFDGEHYLNIARNGYGSGEQAFFPLYPLLIKWVSGLFGLSGYSQMAIVGFIISNVLFLASLFVLFRVIKENENTKLAKCSLILMLLFPTSFYFGAVYTESLFLLSILLSVYFFFKEKYLLGGLLGIIASGTRVVGISLVPIYIFYLAFKKKLNLKNLLSSLLPSLGFLAYSFYQYKTYADPLKFFHVASSFGEQRSDHLILLPQVFYRYFVKILPSLNWNYFPVVFTTLLEVFAALFVIWYLVSSILNIKRENLVFLLISVCFFIIPTLSGSFSSLPRYVVVIFPLFVFLAKVLEGKNKYLTLLVYLLLGLLQVVAIMLFSRGYFVS